MNYIVKKDNRIEIMRILSIIFVIILHVTNRYLTKMIGINHIDNFFLIFINCITRVSVPIFFMISGIFNISKDYNKKKYLSKIIRMIIILIIWTFVYYFLDDYDYKIVDLYHSLFSFLKPHLWYMYALIGLYIANPFISKMVKNLNEEEKRLFVILWLSLSGVYYLIKVIMELFEIDTDITHPIPIFNATYYLGYYVMGYLIYNNYKKLNKYNNKLMIFIAVMCMLVNSLLTYFITKSNNSFFQGFLGYSNILIMIPSIILLIMFLRYVKDKNYRIIGLINPYIFGIYLSHVLVLEYVIEKIKISNVTLGCFAYTTITFIISYSLIFLIKKIPYINKYIC